MRIANFVLFQISWFACVIGAAQGMPWLGVIVTLMTLIWHISTVKQPPSELTVIACVIIMGACFDQWMLTNTWIDYQNHGWSERIVPVWIVALWAAFASTLNVSLAWIKGRYLVAMLLGAMGGPLAYLAAERLGAVTLHGQIAYVLLSCGWAIITPALFYVTSYINRVRAGYKT